MKTDYYNVLGIMSGTSLDGVDIARVTLWKAEGIWRFKIGRAVTVPYTEEWVQKLKHAVNFSAEALDELDTDYTIYLAQIINAFINDNTLQGLDAVCSHGHTVLHQPQQKQTLQIGNKAELAKMIGQRVVCNFRLQDVLMGGQGAPLVPIGDRMLFPEYDFCLNLGGFSNISFERNDRRIAYDISAVNTVLNHYANKLGYPYDDRGAIAAGGNLIAELLQELNVLPYYRRPYPKSLGFEYVRDVLFPLVERYNGSAENVLHTFCDHVAEQIAQAVKNVKHQGSLLITGGGAYNEFLINLLREKMPGITVAIPDDDVIQYKEALIFALLGVLKLRGEVNVLSSVTGAPADHCAGYIFEP